MSLNGKFSRNCYVTAVLFYPSDHASNFFIFLSNEIIWRKFTGKNNNSVRTVSLFTDRTICLINLFYYISFLSYGTLQKNKRKILLREKIYVRIRLLCLGLLWISAGPCRRLLALFGFAYTNCETYSRITCYSDKRKFESVDLKSVSYCVS